MQVAAALVAMTVVAQSFGAAQPGGPGLPPLPAVSISPSGPAAPVETAWSTTTEPPQENVLSLTLEQKEFLDGLYAACQAEDDMELYRLTHLPVAEEIERCYYNGTQAFVHRGNGNLWMEYIYDKRENVTYRHIEYCIKEEEEVRGGYAVGEERFIFWSNENEVGHFVRVSRMAVDEIAGNGATGRSHGYYKEYTIEPGADYSTRYQNEMCSELSGEFVRGPESNQSPDEDCMFLENGTLLTGAWTGSDNIAPLQFEAKNGYLQAEDILTVRTNAYGEETYAFLNYEPTGRGISASWPDDPFYHTRAQKALR